MRSLRWSVAGLLCLTCACFEIDNPPPDAGVPGSNLNGRILVDGVSAQAASAELAQRMRRTRSAIRRLSEGEGVSPSDLAAPRPVRLLAPTARNPSVPPMLGQKSELEWMPGQALVLFEQGRYQDKAAVERALDEVRARARLADVAMRVERCTARHYCLVKLDDLLGKPLSLDETARVALALHEARGDELKVVARDFIKRAFRVPNDPFYLYQWHYDFARMPAAWDISTGDDSIVVAVIDSGAKLLHPDLADRLVAGFDMVSPENISADGNGRDPDPTDPGDEALGEGQSSWHGTHVSGTIAAMTDNSLGVSGVMWQGKVQPVRVLGKGAQGTDSDILDGLYWSVGGEVEGAAPNQTPAKIINMSLGGPADQQGTDFWNDVVETLTNTQKEQYGRPIIVAAAGNTNENVSTIVPANLPGVISVGATRFDGRRAEYSNWGDEVDVMGPGGQVNVDQNVDGYPDGVLSLFDNDYNFEQGTSMAAPHVSGIVGLMVAVDGTLDQAGAIQLLRATANPGGVCNEGCGSGHVDAAQALLAMGGVVQDQPLLAIDVTRLIFQPTVTQLPVAVLNLGSAALTWESAIIGPQAGLFSVSPTSGTLASASGATANVFLSRGAFSSGSANLQFIGSGAAANQVVRVDLFFNDDAVPVQTELNAVQVSAFRVKNEAELELAGQIAAVRTGSFRWTIEDVAPGSYYVFAVGDDDNDGIFDAQRESYGAWPLASAPEPIDVGENQNITGVEFAIAGGFRLSGEGGVGSPCGDALDCTFAADAECIDWPNGYCSRVCDDGFCGAGASCEILECGADTCNVCLSTCVSGGQCRVDEGYLCDPYGTCTPDGF